MMELSIDQSMISLINLKVQKPSTPPRADVPLFHMMNCLAYDSTVKDEYCKPVNFRGSFIFAIFAVTLEERKYFKKGKILVSGI